MAVATTYLASPTFFIGASSGSTVDLTDQCKSVVVTKSRESLDQLLDLADLIREAKIGLTEARPTTVDYGGAAYPAYELTINTKVSP